MNMTQMIFYTHSGWRYVVLLISAVALIKFVIGWIANSEWSKWDQWLLVGFVGAITIQWLLGILLWITYGFPTAGYFIEHIVTMTLAVIPAHMALVRVGRALDSKNKYRTATIYTAISVALLWLGVARITGVL